MRLFYRSLLVIVGCFWLTSCMTPTNNIQLREIYWKHKPKKVVISVAKPPTPQLYHRGSEGLLDYAINSAMNNRMDAALAKLDLSWYYGLPKTFNQAFQSRRIQALNHHNAIDLNTKNYTNFAQALGGDNLLVLKLEQLGAVRNYYGFIPLSAPQAYCKMSGELIDLKSQKVIWRQRSDITLPIEGVWDQPPNYPNLINGIKLAVNTAKQELVDSFFSGH